MLSSFFNQLRGVVSLLLYVVNTLFWAIPIFILALVKLIVPVKVFRVVCEKILNGMAENWIYFNRLNLRCFQNIRWDVQGLDALEPDQWYLVVANHQSWFDILVLQYIFYRKIPFLKFFIKKEMIWLPVLGLAWWAMDFPFMKRYSKSFLQKNPHLRGKDLETTKKFCEKFKTIPVSVMNFVEGTRFSPKKHRRQQSPFTHLLKPKAGGIALVLAVMGEQLHRILNVTIVYPGGSRTFWEFLCGKVDAVRVRVESLTVSEEVRGDYFEDPEFRNRFQVWLNTLWTQKDSQFESLLRP